MATNNRGGDQCSRHVYAYEFTHTYIHTFIHSFIHSFITVMAQPVSQVSYQTSQAGYNSTQHNKSTNRSTHWLASQRPALARLGIEGADAFKKLRALFILVKTEGLQIFELSLQEVLMMLAN